MFGLGTLINTAAIILGGILGLFLGRLLKERHQNSMIAACGISTMFIAIAGAMQGMLSVQDGVISSGQAMLVVICLTLGTLLGEIINLEDRFERFGEWLKAKTGNAKDRQFVNAFVTTSLTVCIGAMAIVGAIQDGILGDWSILATKSILDFIIVIILAGSLGKGSIFSAVPVFLLEGLVTVCASFVKPVITDLAMDYLSMVGSILIFCVGVNLVWGKKIRVANMLPAVVLSVIAAFIPFG